MKRNEEELIKVYQEAKEIMKGLGYTDKQLSCRVALNNRLTRALGRCNNTKRLVEIQSEYFYYTSYFGLMNTMLHELAHLVNTKNDKHGPYWQIIAKKISDNTPYTITRVAAPSENEYKKVSDKYMAFKCLKCEHIYQARLSKKKTIKALETLYHCSRCGGKLKHTTKEGNDN